MKPYFHNPNENHGLGDSIIRGFIQYVVTSFSDDADVFKTLLMDCHDFFVQREWHSIDILAVSQKERFVICIENKIDSKEHDNQLDRYWNAKRERNIKHDAEITARFESRRWKVLRIWECELKKSNRKSLEEKIKRALSAV